MESQSAPEIQYTIQAFPQEELNVFNKELQLLVEKYNGTMIAMPFITEEGLTRAKIMVYKKVELPPQIVPPTSGNGESTQNK